MSLGFHQRHPIMALTQDGLSWSHAEQARRLCEGGARWVQLRVKTAAANEWLAIAQEVVRICHQYSAICIVNDSVEIALASGADGVHLGKLDLEWQQARQQLGLQKILGGTINNQDDVNHALAVKCLDYVGVGPWRFTANKKNLAPILGGAGVATLIAELGGLPAWIIGGVELTDLPEACSTGAAGVAVSSAFYRGGYIEKNVGEFVRRWTDSVGRSSDKLFSAETKRAELGEVSP